MTELVSFDVIVAIMTTIRKVVIHVYSACKRLITPDSIQKT